ncbi:hypothetical protein GALL_460570 [mine drainage metagenome]|uniref:Uncharacterized protein n=1 Tax=mine drainage metagenome TaxID=410659 RepID=A0A1J5PLA1_9ZZZZ
MSEYLLDAGIKRQFDPSVAGARHHLQIVRRPGRRGCRVADGPALHEDDRLLPVASDRSRCQTEHVLRLGPFQDGVEGDRANVVTFVDDHLSVALDQRAHLALAGQGLHHGNVDLAGRLGLAAADGADHALADAQKRLQPLLPLLQQLGAMHQHQGVDAPPGDHRGGDDRLAEGRRRAEHPGIKGLHRCDGGRLVLTQTADKRHVQRLAANAFVSQVAGDAVLAQQRQGGIQTPAGQRDVPRVVLGAADDTRLVPHRHAHRLRLVERGVLERRQADQAIGQWLRQLRLLEVDQVGQGHRQRAGHEPRQLLRRRTLALPRCGQVLVVDEGDVQRMPATRGPQDGRLNVVRGHRLDGGQECPLVRVGAQLGVDEDAETLIPRALLQRQGDQVAEPAFGYRVLIREQPVVGREPELPRARAGVADGGRAQAADIACRHAAGEEHPGMGALTGSRNLQRRRHAQLSARLHEGPRVVPPIRLVEIDGQEAAAVVLQQRVHPDRVLAGQVLVDHRVRQRDKQAMAAIAALDARLVAHTGAPLIRAGRRVARLARGLALPTDRIHVGAAAKEASEESDLLVGGQPRRLDDRPRGLWMHPPFDAVRLKQRDQARVLRAQIQPVIAMFHQIRARSETCRLRH